MIWDETGNAGYGLFDRALGAAYLNGLWEAASQSGQSRQSPQANAASRVETASK